MWINTEDKTYPEYNRHYLIWLPVEKKYCVARCVESGKSMKSPTAWITSQGSIVETGWFHELPEPPVEAGRDTRKVETVEPARFKRKKMNSHKGRKIRKRRLAVNLSENELAQLAGVSVDFLIAFESGETDYTPSYGFMNDINRVLSLYEKIRTQAIEEEETR